MMAASSILYFFFFSFTLLGLLEASIYLDKCTTQPCSSSATFSVRFPFRLPNYQPYSRCGYNSNFTLSCDAKKTLLHLPNSGSFAIETIDYSKQKVTLTDTEGCFPQRFLDLDLSSSPFSSNYSEKYSYFNCTRLQASNGNLSIYEVPCMSDTNYAVVVILSGTIESKVWEMNCTAIKTFVSAPIDIYLHHGQIKFVDLYWDEPGCGACAIKGQVCGFKGSSNLIECQDATSLSSPAQYGSSPPADSNSSDSLIIKLVAGILSLVGLVMTACHTAAMCCKTTEEEQLNQQETEMIHAQPSTATEGLSETATELNSRLV